MRNPCPVSLEGLVDLAVGRESPQTAEHAKRCEACAAALSQFRRMVSRMAIGFADAPGEALEQAFSIRLPERRTAAMRLFGSTLRATGARRDRGESFQLTFQHGEVNVRLQYRFEGVHWEIMGRVEPGVGWFAENNNGEVPVADDGRFAFAAAALAGTALQLIGPNETLLIPPADQVDEDESKGAD